MGQGEWLRRAAADHLFAVSQVALKPWWLHTIPLQLVQEDAMIDAVKRLAGIECRYRRDVAVVDMLLLHIFGSFHTSMAILEPVSYVKIGQVNWRSLTHAYKRLLFHATACRHEAGAAFGQLSVAAVNIDATLTWTEPGLAQ